MTPRIYTEHCTLGPFALEFDGFIECMIPSRWHRCNHVRRFTTLTTKECVLFKHKRLVVEEMLHSCPLKLGSPWGSEKEFPNIRTNSAVSLAWGMLQYKFKASEISCVPKLFAELFYRFAQNTAAITPCSVQNFKTILQPKYVMYERVSVGFVYCERAPWCDIYRSSYWYTNTKAAA